MKIVLHSEVLLGMEQLLIAFVQRVEWAQELLKENCGERKALWCARRRIPLPRGMTRRLRHGSRACSSMGRSHFSFDGERKVCKRKPAARRLQRRPTSLCAVGFGLREPFGLSSASARCAHPPGKSPLLPIFERGSSQCRAQHCWRDNSYIRARSCSLFSSFKKGKAFSLRCLSPLCSAAS